ncbi:MAG TPA: polyprenol monophosphomannose synthase [Thermoleophilaceae bacterium]|jgi:dolichol-phosphate mannosyltransferase|nr:polyprenol monophosphomannose synthase [Thermoleophilaceae bacterium]
MPVAWLILPTYNEAENIGPIVRSARAHLRPDDRILVVDDNSPDGTGALANDLAQELEGVEVLHRPEKQGLGRAYLAGFAYVLQRDAELVLEMDADFSHDPADLPRLIATAEERADLVLGSRYVAGGSVTDWGLLRKLVSRGGSWYARVILGVKVRDLTGGFKCFRRSVLEALDLDAIHADGYGFQIELTYRTVQAGFRVVEIPIIFRDRRVGESKMNARIALEAVWKVPALRRRRAANLS